MFQIEDAQAVMAVFRKIRNDFEKAVRLGHRNGLRSTAAVEDISVSEEAIAIEEGGEVPKGSSMTKEGELRESSTTEKGELRKSSTTEKGELRKSSTTEKGELKDRKSRTKKRKRN